jgi:hypothetical protein
MLTTSDEAISLQVEKREESVVRANVVVLLEQRHFLRLVEPPRLLRGRQWFVTPGRSPHAVYAN